MGRALMQLEKGSTRIVLVFEETVIKIARVHFLKALQAIFIAIISGCFWRVIRMPIYGCNSPGKFLFGGFAENWNEYLYYKKNPSRLLAPSYFSLLGIFNVQKRIPRLEIAENNFWTQLYVLTDGAIVEDNHTFQQLENFGYLEKSLYVLDYGSPDCQNLIKEYGQRIANEFDPSFSGDEKRLNISKSNSDFEID